MGAVREGKESARPPKAGKGQEGKVVCTRFAVVLDNEY